MNMWLSCSRKSILDLSFRIILASHHMVKSRSTASLLCLPLMPVLCIVPLLWDLAGRTSRCTWLIPKQVLFFYVPSIQCPLLWAKAESISSEVFLSMAGPYPTIFATRSWRWPIMASGHASSPASSECLMAVSPRFSAGTRRQAP